MLDKWHDHPVIFHVDCDAFFVSCVLRDRPELADKPVAVGCNPRRRPTRGVIQTTNYVARQYGVQSGMSVKEALRRCPELKFVTGDFSLYSRVSHSVKSILAEFVENDNQLRAHSIDDFSLNMSSRLCWDDVREIRDVARDIKDLIHQQERITVSVGVAHHRMLAKIASGLEKPDGLVILHPKDLPMALESHPLDVILGIGKKTAENMKKKGFHLIRDLTGRSRLSLCNEYFIYLWDVLHGHLTDSRM